MNKLACLLWAFFFASMFFGVWVIPILVFVAAVSVFLKYKHPDGFDEYQ